MMKIDQALQVEVIRREFFRGARGTITYVESSPPAPPHEHQVEKETDKESRKR